MNNNKKEQNMEILQIPLSVLQDRSVAVLESIVEYLKEEKNLKYSEIATLLNRDQRTIWTVYNRVKKKRNLKNKNAKK